MPQVSLNGIKIDYQEFSHEIKVIAHRMRLSNLQIEERPR